MGSPCFHTPYVKIRFCLLNRRQNSKESVLMLVTKWLPGLLNALRHNTAKMQLTLTFKGCLCGPKCNTSVLGKKHQLKATW